MAKNSEASIKRRNERKKELRRLDIEKIEANELWGRTVALLFCDYIRSVRTGELAAADRYYEALLVNGVSVQLNDKRLVWEKR